MTILFLKNIELAKQLVIFLGGWVVAISGTVIVLGLVALAAATPAAAVVVENGKLKRARHKEMSSIWRDIT